MPKCTICHHPERQAIDCALLTDKDNYAALSQHYGPSISALWRHKKHLQEKIRQTEKRLRTVCARRPSSATTTSWNRPGRLSAPPAPTATPARSSGPSGKAPGFSTSSPNWKSNLTRTRSTVFWPLPNGFPRTASCPPTPASSPAPVRLWPRTSSFPARKFPLTLKQRPGTQKMPPPPTWAKLPVSKLETRNSKHQTRHPLPCPKNCLRGLLRNSSSKSSPDWTTGQPTNPKPKTDNWQAKTNRKTSAKFARNYRINHTL